MTWFRYIQLSQTTVRMALFVNARSRSREVCEFDNVRKRMSVLLRMPSGEILLYVKGADSSILPHVLEPVAPEIPRNPRTPRKQRKQRKPKSGNQSALVMIVSHSFTSFHIVSIYNYVILIIFCVDLENCYHGKDDTFDSKEARKFTSRDMWHLLRQAAKEQCDSHLLTFARQGEADIRVLELSACDDCAENIWKLEHMTEWDTNRYNTQ